MMLQPRRIFRTIPTRPPEEKTLRRDRLVNWEAPRRISCASGYRETPKVWERRPSGDPIIQPKITKYNMGSSFSCPHVAKAQPWEGGILVQGEDSGYEVS